MSDDGFSLPFKGPGTVVIGSKCIRMSRQSASYFLITGEYIRAFCITKNKKVRTEVNALFRCTSETKLFQKYAIKLLPSLCLRELTAEVLPVLIIKRRVRLFL
jgi:hypothetical protein